MRPRVILAAVLVGLLQTGAIAAIIANRAIHIAYGREIVLDVVPVDPRDLLRGDYVRLDYSVSRPSGPTVKLPGKPNRGMPIFVTLEKQGKPGDEKWVAVAASAVRPALPETDGKAVLQGRLQWWHRYGPERDLEHGPWEISLRYGIETYFVPETTGRDLEKLTRKGAVKIIVALDRNGKAAIKGIIVEGKRHDESLL